MKFKSLFPLFISILFSCYFAQAQNKGTLSGTVSLNSSTGKKSTKIEVFIKGISLSTQCDKNNRFLFKGIDYGQYVVVVFAEGYKMKEVPVSIQSKTNTVNIEVEELFSELKTVEVTDTRDNYMSSHLNAVEGVGIYEAKKTELITLKNVSGNLATNNSRQIYAKIAGLNIWESDGGGIQLEIGGRGLSPHRTSNFNTRQNGYDISADALGYPESYYSPSTEALKEIEIIRGAASLQYGPQFGGMVNFVFKEAPEDKPFYAKLRQTAGSWNFINSYNEIGGTVGKFDYWGFFQYKSGDGWRPNSEYQLGSGFGRLGYSFSEDTKLSFEYTRMAYHAHQPGGLTDDQFDEDPRQSNRERNWFGVDWNLYALIFDHQFSNNSILNLRTFHLQAGRDALGFLGQIHRPDPINDPTAGERDKERDLYKDLYSNYGAELRWMYKYDLFGNSAALLTGARYYYGVTDRKQGSGSTGYDADFNYLTDPLNKNRTEHLFPNTNMSFFVENLFEISPKLSITPGARIEYIDTRAKGISINEKTLGNGIVIGYDTLLDDKNNNRLIGLVGVGMSYKPTEEIDIYSNFSRNYRPVNFNDMRVTNPNLKVDPNLKDEHGFNFDIGARGNIVQNLHYDISLFYLSYQDKIGITTTRDNGIIRPYRTNIGKAYTAGLEALVEADLLNIGHNNRKNTNLITYVNFSIIQSAYTATKDENLMGNKVENVPPLGIKTGLTYRYKKFQTSLQYGYTQAHYTDALNTGSTGNTVPNAVRGVIPSYYVADFSASYTYKKWKLESGINNLTDNMYFTRRAEGYPGPGILPSDGRSFYVTLELNIF